MLLRSCYQSCVHFAQKHRQENNNNSEAVAHALEDAIGDMLKTDAPPPPPPPMSPPSTLPPAPPPPGIFASFLFHHIVVSGLKKAY